MIQNIHKLFRDYNKLSTDTQKSKFIASLDFEKRETFKNLINYANNSNRFENIYDGWIENIDEEFVVLEVYSEILNTKKTLNQYCVSDNKYNEFVEHKKRMLTLLLENKQYKHALSLLDVYMFSEEFKQEKLSELRTKVLEYLISKKMVLPKKLINEIYSWVDELKLPSYLTTDLDSEFSFTITNDAIPLTTLKEDVESELSKNTGMNKIVENLILENKVIV